MINLKISVKHVLDKHLNEQLNIENIAFSKNKYGDELLIDVATISDMPSFEKSPTPYRIDFYDITLITSGIGSFWLDNQVYDVSPGTVLFTSPGQVRRWLVSDLDGICLFFPAEFILEHFNDTLFLHRLLFFHANQALYSLNLSVIQSKKLSERLTTMRNEITQLRQDSAHLLRAIAYEILVNLNRWYAEKYQLTIDEVTESVVTKFRELLESDFYKKHKVSDYANTLAISPGHLNFLCKKHIGQTASNIIERRIFAEASRLLIHTEKDVGIIASYLGFVDQSYFSRAFKRNKGVSPLRYRIIGKKKLDESF